MEHVVLLTLISFILIIGQVCIDAGSENVINVTGTSEVLHRRLGKESKLANLQAKLKKQLEPANLWHSHSKGVQPSTDLDHKVRIVAAVRFIHRRMSMPMMIFESCLRLWF